MSWVSLVLWFPISIIARIILYSIGWSSVSTRIFSQITKYDRVVLIYAHTSYADFFILILYLLSYPYSLHTVKTLVQPRPFKYFGWFLRPIGAIPSTKLEDKNGGAVARIVSELDKSDKFLFLISPKGTIANQSWRSGYYHIAQKLNIPLMIGAIDYERKAPHVSEHISSNHSELEIKSYLLSELSNVVPLYPEREIVPIRKHDISKRSIIDKRHLCQTLIIFTTILYIGTYLTSYLN